MKHRPNTTAPMRSAESERRAVYLHTLKGLRKRMKQAVLRRRTFAKV